MEKKEEMNVEKVKKQYQEMNEFLCEFIERIEQYQIESNQSQNEKRKRIDEILQTNEQFHMIIDELMNEVENIYKQIQIERIYLKRQSPVVIGRRLGGIIIENGIKQTISSSPSPTSPTSSSSNSSPTISPSLSMDIKPTVLLPRVNKRNQRITPKDREKVIVFRLINCVGKSCIDENFYVS